MRKFVVKRTGEHVNFEEEKIEKAIKSAIIAIKTDMDFEAIEDLSKLICGMVTFRLRDLKEIPIELIQDKVEESFMSLGLTDVARAYVKYRNAHEKIREDKKLMISVDKLIKSYVTEEDWKVKENSNMAYSLQGLNNHIVTEVSKNFWLNHIFSEEQGEAHKSGDIHIHDLGLLSTYCCGWDVEDLLLKGFKGVRNKVQSGPPKHLRSALGQLVNFFYTLQGEASGAQAVASFDTYFAPFVRFDNLDYSQLKQIMQAFIFNLNVPTRVGFQTPFTNITMDLTVSPILKNKNVIYGGEVLNEYVYGDFQEEINLINKAFAEVMMKGDAFGRIFSFPIPTYNITKDFDWENEVVNSVLEMTAKYGIPYFANFVNSDMSPEDARSMCCRLRLDNRELRKRGGGLFGANPLTGSIGVITINLPRLGYKCKGNILKLKEELKKLMDLSKAILETKRKFIEKNTKMGLYPYSRYYLSSVYERFGEYWKNHFSTIGLNGMNECIRNFTSDVENITTENGQKFAEEVLNYMREIITEYQNDGSLYNLEATPAEGTGYRLALIDKKKYPDILQAGQAESYYTNSTQLPVGHTNDLFEALNLQDNLQTKYTGGTVLHGFLGENIQDTNTLKILLKKVFEKYKLPYFSITPTFSICEDHGYIKGEEFSCPTCQKETEVWSRVVGFYRPVQDYNKGKKEEYGDRMEYMI